MRCAYCDEPNLDIGRVVGDCVVCVPCATHGTELESAAELFGCELFAREGLIELTRSGVVLRRGNAQALARYLRNQPIPFKVSA